jgi:hypothetical protein
MIACQAWLTHGALGRELLKAQVEKTWTLDEARVEAFRNAPLTLDLSAFPLRDPNYDENSQIGEQGGGRIGNRLITVFQQGRYSVTDTRAVNQESFSVPYYTVSGMLYAVDVNHRGYPRKTYKYASRDNPAQRIRAGQLVRIAIEVAPMNSYTFNVDGSMDAHWEGEHCTRRDGSSCGRRKIMVSPDSGSPGLPAINDKIHLD